MRRVKGEGTAIPDEGDYGWKGEVGEEGEPLHLRDECGDSLLWRGLGGIDDEV